MRGPRRGRAGADPHPCGRARMTLDPFLLGVLACPIDKGALVWFEDEEILYNPRLHKRYSVTGGIPVLLADEAVDVDGPEHERLMAKAEKDGHCPPRDPIRDPPRGAPACERLGISGLARVVGGGISPARRAPRAARQRPEVCSERPGGASSRGTCAWWPQRGWGPTAWPHGPPPRCARRTSPCRSGSSHDSPVPRAVDDRCRVLRAVVRR